MKNTLFTVQSCNERLDKRQNIDLFSIMYQQLIVHSQYGKIVNHELVLCAGNVGNFIMLLNHNFEF